MIIHKSFLFVSVKQFAHKYSYDVERKSEYSEKSKYENVYSKQACGQCIDIVWTLYVSNKNFNLLLLRKINKTPIAVDFTWHWKFVQHEDIIIRTISSKYLYSQLVT